MIVKTKTYGLTFLVAVLILNAAATRSGFAQVPDPGASGPLAVTVWNIISATPHFRQLTFQVP